jgi:hypothetical protein
LQTGFIIRSRRLQPALNELPREDHYQRRLKPAATETTTETTYLNKILSQLPGPSYRTLLQKKTEGF